MRLLAPAAAAVLLLVLTGCSEPEPGSPMLTGRAPATSAEPSATASATTASPTPTSDTPEPTQASEPAPTLPPEATTNDAAGAEAFVRYWYDTLNHAIATGDTAPLREVSLLPECLECEELAASVESAYSEGGRLSDGRAEVVEAVAPNPDGTGLVLLSVVVDQEPVVTLNRRGDEVGRSSTTESGVSSQSVVISRNGDANSWLLVGLAK